MLSAWRQKVYQEEQTSGNQGAKEAGDVKAEMERHLAEGPKTDVPDNWRGDACCNEPQDLEDDCDDAMWTTHSSTTVSSKHMSEADFGTKNGLVSHVK